MQCFLVRYRGICHLSLVFSSNTSDAWHIPRYPTRNHCITSMHCIVLYFGSPRIVLRSCPCLYVNIVIVILTFFKF